LILLVIVPLLFASCGDNDDVTPPPGDTTAPATVSNLEASAVSTTFVDLTWTAPGDDGAEGTAASYDLRYSSVPMSDENWDKADEVVGEPEPQKAGSAEALTVNGLEPGTTYFFALKTSDDAENVSGLSNVVSATTGTTLDVTPPAAVQLVIVEATDRSVALTWSSPGDDGDEGTAAEYDLRYSTSPLDEGSWDGAEQVTDEPDPQEAGSTEAMIVSGLDPGTTYDFGLRTADEVPNWSELSNIVQVTTAPPSPWWDGFAPPPDGAGMNNWVSTLVEYNGDLIAGGLFTNAGGEDMNYIARWDGDSWSPLGSGVSGGIFPLVESLIVYNGDLIVGGSFETAGGSGASNIARWDGASWHPLGSGVDGGVEALAIHEGDLIAGGWFGRAGGLTARLVARWDGQDWSALGVGFRHPVVMTKTHTLLVFDGELYAGGGFSHTGTREVGQLARFDGSDWQRAGPELTVSGEARPYVEILGEFGGELYMGGFFDTADGVLVNGLARWSGDQWQPVVGSLGGESPNLAMSMTVFGRELIVGGHFADASGIPARNIAAFDGVTWRALGSGIESDGFTSVQALLPFRGDLYVGGFFDTAGGKPSQHIARLFGGLLYRPRK
jgi:hypothetical protein